MAEALYAFTRKEHSQQYPIIVGMGRAIVCIILWDTFVYSALKWNATETEMEWNELPLVVYAPLTIAKVLLLAVALSNRIAWKTCC